MRISDLVQAGWDVVEVTPEWTPHRVRATVMAKVVERRRLLGDGMGPVGDVSRGPAGDVSRGPAGDVSRGPAGDVSARPA
jgi:hypothetical protein